MKQKRTLCTASLYKSLKRYENTSLTVIPNALVNDDVAASIIKDKTILINELMIEYRNISGKKYQLTFKPNEKDMDKRNVCKRI